MPKEKRILSVPSNRTRVSPYPLRSSRTKKEKEPESRIQTEGPSEWEDVLCVICQEAPHNAVLLRCSSSSSGCRTYMCDTSVRHSNCFKQYRRKNRNRVTKALNCPYCRGEVYETMKVSGARRYMNAKPRSCAFEDCNFSGTYSQLKNHLKAEHPGYTRPLVDLGRQRAWDQMQTASEHNEIMSAAGIPHNPQELVHYHHLPYYTLDPHPVMHFRVHGGLQNFLFAPQARTGFAVADYAAPPLMPGRLTIDIFRGWTP